MSKVRVLVGTRKGAFILSSDASRKTWSVEGPHFAGWEIYHLKASPVNPDRLYASQTSGWFGQVLQRSDDGGKTWAAAGNQFLHEGTTGTHKWYDGSDHPWEFKRAWHLEPSLNDPEKVYAGVEDAALFESQDGGTTWKELPALGTHDTASQWAPGAGGMCLHTIVIDPANQDRMYVAISSAGTFRSDDAGTTWRPINHGLRSGALGRSPGPEMIQVVLPKNLQILAGVGRVVEVPVTGGATQRAVLDALEAAHPALLGTMRDPMTKKRRPMIRFFACEEDLSDEPIDAPLPDEVVSGKQPLLIIGAIAGG